jgi:hypothetical protein
MSVIARFPSIGIQTKAQLRQAQRRFDRRQGEAARVLAAMQAGAALHLSYARHRQAWQLSDGTSVPFDIAAIVIAKSCVASVGDALFDDLPAQTWRFIELTEDRSNER